MPFSKKHTSCKARISLRLILLIVFLLNVVCATSKRCPESSECADQSHCDKMTNRCKSEGVFPAQICVCDTPRIIFPLQYIGIFVLALLMSLVTSAGLGGGEIVVPVIKIFFGFSQPQASPVSTSCIMMAGIVTKQCEVGYYLAATSMLSGMDLLLIIQEMCVLILYNSTLRGLYRFIINYNKRESIKYNRKCATCARLCCSSKSKPEENASTCRLHMYSNRERVPIRYNICMILLPAIFLGLTLGHSLHQILPEVIQEVMLLMVLAFCMYESIHKGMENWRKETEHQKEAHLPILPVKEFSDNPKFNVNKDTNREDLFTAGEIIGEATLQNYEESKKDHNYEQAVQEFLESEKSHWQFSKLFPIWIIFSALVVQSFLKDSGMVTIQACSFGYWTVYIKKVPNLI